MAKTIFHTKSEDAVYLVEKLKERNSMRRFTFVPVEEKRIKSIKGKGMLIWGDGNQHHFSRFFDLRLDDPALKGDRPIIKVNVDQHEDTFEDAFGYLKKLGCGNHMLFTAADENFMVYLAVPRRHKWLAERVVLYGEHNNIKYLAYEDTAGLGKKKAHLTIDFDAINKFPVCPEWLSYNSCYSAEQFMDMINMLAKMDVVRLDLGGFWCPTNRERKVKLHEALELRNLPEDMDEIVFCKENFKKSIDIVENVIHIFEHLAER